MYFNLIPLLRKKTAALVLHVGTKNSSNETLFQIYDKLLNLVHKESKSKNNSGIQDESQECEKFTDFLFNILKHHSNKIDSYNYKFS